ncbi:MAG: type III-B CRISPR module RAMP protein Cmr6 [Saprospiraceae bacterium]|nr:type III-B CRISPR module RAMP protein Cmr6 [Saprospiraceae bacterium]MCF8250964.1 type III-B CRISPR module RAMP protein Cmr6 [Saprospiraceae bacterium]MCF8281941.1 type III-B CRISPR module RAMP protein Cmr6 [Bacteroidales bacterium]MCF8311928.1 type III-B CRISPR module RAMP protein Cmr6 [Saprospiraceae bacterium]MCF8441936.1 type III-B CRISPR module RAMP protein Cmr6 [Saprospiraceae bacterium]
MTIADNLIAPPYAAANDLGNMGWLFYRDYFNGDPKTKNRKLEAVNEPRSIPLLEGGLANTRFHLKTTYPGLLIGTGYLHEHKKEGEDDKTKNESIKIGFYFDHATGMPVVPGSSVKGALRGAFPQFTDEEAAIGFDENRVDELPAGINKAETKAALPLKKERALFVHCLLFLIEEERAALNLEELQAIHEFERETFEGRIPGKVGNEKGENFLGLYRRDLFFEAVPVAILNANNGGYKQLFGMDYITPHKHKTRPELDPFTDPTPLKFLKVMPEVVYEFRFRLQPSKVWSDGRVDADTKEHFFQNMLLLLGVGAKTNVGYGHFSDDLTLDANGGGVPAPPPPPLTPPSWQDDLGFAQK